MKNRLADFDRRGVGIAAIAMCEPSILERYLKLKQWPFAVYCDPKRALYDRLGLGRTTWLRIFYPANVWKYIRLILRGNRVRRVFEGEDPLQLGGDALIDPQRRLRWIYRSRTATDRPTLLEILKQIDRLIENHEESHPFRR